MAYIFMYSYRAAWCEAETASHVQELIVAAKECVYRSKRTRNLIACYYTLGLGVMTRKEVACWLCELSCQNNVFAFRQGRESNCRSMKWV